MVLAHNMLKPRPSAGATTAWRTAFFNHRVSNMRQSRLSGHSRCDPRLLTAVKFVTVPLLFAGPLRTPPSDFSIVDKLEQSEVPPARTDSQDSMVSC